MSAATLPGDRLTPARRSAMIVGALGAALCVLGAALDRPQFFRSYLVGYTFWVGIGLGCLALLMLHHLVGGTWGLAIRRPLEAGALTLPLLAPLFVPVALGLRTLYPWTHPEFVEHHPALRHKLDYLNTPFFLSRAATYFAIWAVLALLLRRWSLAEDRTGQRSYSRRLQAISGPGMVLTVLTGSFAAIDWIMSLEPAWYSTIFGVLWMTGDALATMSLMVLVVTRLLGPSARPDVHSAATLNDLGNLLLTFVMLWAYMSFSQYLIIWSGNLAEEVPWYLRRNRGGWQWLAIVLIVFQFALPFLMLLFHDAKRSTLAMGRIAGLIFAMHLLATYWIVAPAYHEGGPRVHWLDLAAPVGLGGLWLAAFFWQLAAHPAVPPHAAGAVEEHPHHVQGGA